MHPCRPELSLFDPGGSLADGERLRAAIRARTSLPIRYVVLSHAHPDHFFGAEAFAADRPQLVGHERLPGMLADLKAQPARRAVPGHGPTGVDWPQGSADLERYLDTVLSETRSAIRKGVPIEEAVNVVGQSERGKWALFDDYHGRNVTQAFKELEWE